MTLKVRSSVAISSLIKIALGTVFIVSVNSSMRSEAFAASDCPCFAKADIIDKCGAGNKQARRLVRDLSKGLYALKIECENKSYLLDNGFTYPGGSGDPLKAVCQISDVRWSDGNVVSTTGGPSSNLTPAQAQACSGALENALSELNLTAY